MGDYTIRYTEWIMPVPPKVEQRTFPPVMRWGLYYYVGLSVFFALAAIGWVVFRKPLGVPRGFAFRYGALLMGLVPLVVLTPVWLFRTRHIRRILLQSGGRVCTHCAYDVSRLPAAGTCPECGQTYDVEKDKPLWEAVGADFGGASPPVGVPSRDQTKGTMPPA